MGLCLGKLRYSCRLKMDTGQGLLILDGSDSGYFGQKKAI